MIPPGGPRGVFVTGTGTEIGKTFVTRGIARALTRLGTRAIALKPVETGCEPDPLDALALARACGRPEAVDPPGFYRVAPPVAPLAATLMGQPAPPRSSALARSIADAAGTDLALVEGAGGLFVPLADDDDFAALAHELALPILLVTRDTLGVLSHTRAVLLAARAVGLEIGAIALTRPDATDDPSRRHNAEILAEHGVPVHVFGRCPDDDEALGDEAERAGLVDRVLALTGR